MKPKKPNPLKTILDTFLRHKKLILISLLTAVTIGTYIYIDTPKIFQATALIIYQQQKVSPSKMSPYIQAKSKQMINTLTQQVTSRTNLENIIKQFKLYSEKLKTLPMEIVVEKMRNNIAIRASKGDVFKVTFTGYSPKNAMMVTNALASKFIEENLRYREEKASETSAYVKDELAMSKAVLDKKEALMRDYKLKYYNELPQQLSINMARLNGLQVNYQDTMSGIRELERTRILIQQQISLRKEAINEAISKQEKLGTKPVFPNASNSKKDRSSQEYLAYNESLRNLEQARANLKILQLKYTDSHPAVKKAQNIVTTIEEYHRLLTKSLPNRQEVMEDAEAVQKEEIKDSQLAQLTLQLLEVNNDIEQQKAAKTRISKNIEQYKEWINATPVREAEWTALTRDYNQFSNHYQELVSINLTAESSENLERRQQGSQFKIIDPAHFPEKPFKPSFQKNMSIAISMGLIVGLLLSLLIESTDSSFKDAEELENFTEIPVICTVPIINTIKEQRITMLKSALWSISLILASLSLLACIAYFVHKEIIII